MLRLLIDTSVWLDMAKRRDGQQIIVPLRVLMSQGKLQLIVPPLILDEFERNRPRAEAAASASVRERFRLLRQDLQEYGDDETQQRIAEMVHQIPYVSARALQNFSEISELLRKGKQMKPGEAERAAVVRRALDKKAPFHLNKNSVADALLIELYGTVLSTHGDPADLYAFATSNHQDFSVPNGDCRKPHPDFGSLFSDRSHYVYEVDGLISELTERLGVEFSELADETEFLQEETRSLTEIIQAESEYFDRIWYGRSKMHDSPDGCINPEFSEGLRATIQAARLRIEEEYGVDTLWPVSDWEWGFLHGKLSALRWVTGSEWDFLDT